MGNNKVPRIIFNCDNCGKQTSDSPSMYARKNRHFCCAGCYAVYRRDKMPREEQQRFGSGLPESERVKRRRARTALNHYLRDKKIARPKCEVYGNEKSEAHHDDYDKPLEVRWLCFKHHRAYHKKLRLIHENKELLK